MDWLLERFETANDTVAFIHDGRKVTYSEVISKVRQFYNEAVKAGISIGQRVLVYGDYSPEVFCEILALWQLGAIVIPLTKNSVVEETVALAVSGCDWSVTFDDSAQEPEIKKYEIKAESPLLTQFVAEKQPGMILFSSGSTGAPKGILHNANRILAKFQKKRASVIAIPFLMIDHFGGINTILGITSSLGTVVTVRNRSIGTICRAIQDNKVQLLPATPSFLTLLMTSDAYKEFDLSSLQRITYGTEVMPQTTLDRAKAAFPNAVLQQTYGLSEVGVLRSQSRDDGSLWVRIGGEGFQTKIVDDVLWIKSDYAMVGYLNAPQEFDEDGWFNTKDRVEVDGEYVKILGRTTDLINVGGQKVYPIEVENAILGMDNIKDVAVFGEKNPLLGQIVVAKVQLVNDETVSSLKKRIRSHCSECLASYKIPTKVVVTDEDLCTARQKKKRSL